MEYGRYRVTVASESSSYAMNRLTAECCVKKATYTKGIDLQGIVHLFALTICNITICIL